MARRPVATAVAHVAGAALLAWVYGGDLALWVRVQSAPVAALVEPPGLVLPVLGLLLTAGGLGLLAAGLWRGRDAAWRGYRLFPLAAVVLLFVDFGVLSSVRVAMSSTDRALIAVQLVAEAAIAGAVDGHVPADPRAFEPVLARLGPVPWLVHGERRARWLLDLRTCEGPATDAGGKPPGTLVYCVAPDRSRGWVTVVGLPLGQRFGEAAVVSTDAAWVGSVTVEPLPTPPEEPDSGR